jgi:hypothetical protein
VRIIALYDIFLVELEKGMKVSPSERDCLRVERRTFVGILTFPFGVMTNGLVGLRKSKGSER